MTRLAFHPEALDEFEAAVRYYEQQQAGLGNRFVGAVELALDNILHAPLTWPVLAQDVRRKLVRVFPYALLYSVEPDGVLVLAVMHCHQRPGYWRNRTGA